MLSIIKTGYKQWTGTVGMNSFIIKRQCSRRWITILNGRVSPVQTTRREAVALLCRTLEVG